jgi:hypothetical protein
MHNAGLVLPVVAESSVASFELFSRIVYREVLLCEVCHKIWCSSLKKIIWFMILFFTEHMSSFPGHDAQCCF